MNAQQLVVLYGDSLLLDSVEAILAGEVQISVIRLLSATPEVAERICALMPDLVIFDLDAGNFRGLIPFLKACPGAPLLGLDIATNRAVSLTSRVHTVSNQEDLRRVVERYVDQIVSDPRPETSPHPTVERAISA